MKISHNKLSKSFANVRFSTFRIKDGYTGKLLGHGIGYRRHILRIMY